MVNSTDISFCTVKRKEKKDEDDEESDDEEGDSDDEEDEDDEEESSEEEESSSDDEEDGLTPAERAKEKAWDLIQVPVVERHSCKLSTDESAIPHSLWQLSTFAIFRHHISNNVI